MVASTLSGRRFAASFGLAACILALGLASSPALATFHLMVIQEVFPGPPPDAPGPSLTPDQRGQYVMLRMTSSGQNLVTGTSIRVEDADGNVLGSFGSFTASAGTGGALGCVWPNCPAVLMGTQAARNLFTFNFDKLVNGQAGRVALPLSGGRVCFLSGISVMDCVAWGNFDCNRAAPGSCAGANTVRSGELSANGCDTDYGAPAPALQFGKVLARSAFSCIAKDNAVQFASAFPRPVNNAGQSNNTDTDADGLIDQLDCNDASNQFRWPATEVANDRVTGGAATVVTWDSQAATAGPGVTYDVVRGTLAHLNGFTDAACQAANVASASASDPGAPPAGTGFYYLTRAGAGAGCVGTYGSQARDTAAGNLCP